MVPDIAEADLIFPYPIPEKRADNVATKSQGSSVKDFGSPSLISVNQKLTIAVTNGDIVFDVNKSSKEKGTGNKINSVVESIVKQKSLYPVNPTQNPFDITKTNALNFEDGPDGTKPNIWFMPSKLKKFIEVIYFFLIK